MNATPAIQSSNAPLAFSLSIRSESAMRTLHANAVDRTSQLAGTVLGTSACVAVVATLLYLWLPLWLCIPLAAIASWKCFGFAKAYFEGGYVNGRVQSNRHMLLNAIDEQDASRFAGVVATITGTHYGNQQWAIRANTLLNQPEADAYLYLATVFAHVPQCWSQGAQQVYGSLLAEVTPAP